MRPVKGKAESKILVWFYWDSEIALAKKLDEELSPQSVPDVDVASRQRSVV
jgi:hypothetical protein